MIFSKQHRKVVSWRFDVTTDALRSCAFDVIDFSIEKIATTRSRPEHCFLACKWPVFALGRFGAEANKKFVPLNFFLL